MIDGQQAAEYFSQIQNKEPAAIRVSSLLRVYRAALNHTRYSTRLLLLYGVIRRPQAAESCYRVPGVGSEAWASVCRDPFPEEDVLTTLVAIWKLTHKSITAVLRIDHFVRLEV